MGEKSRAEGTTRRDLKGWPEIRCSHGTGWCLHFVNTWTAQQPLSIDLDGGPGCCCSNTWAAVIFFLYFSPPCFSALLLQVNFCYIEPFCILLYLQQIKSGSIHNGLSRKVNETLPCQRFVPIISQLGYTPVARVVNL